MPDTETTTADLEVAATTGAAHALIALAQTRAAGATPTPDAEGAEVVWDHAPDIPYVGEVGGRMQLYDAYMDAWYDVVHAALVSEALAVEFRSGLRVPGGGWEIKVVAL